MKRSENNRAVLFYPIQNCAHLGQLSTTGALLSEVEEERGRGGPTRGLSHVAGHCSQVLLHFASTVLHSAAPIATFVISASDKISDVLTVLHHSVHNSK